MLKYYLRTVVVSFNVYGVGRVFWESLFVESFIKIFTALTLLLDHVFFRKFRTVQVQKPLFIIGHPRSGTTFLHHLMTSTNGAAAFKAWHLIFPSLTARLFLKPLIEAKIRSGKSELAPDWTGHKMDLGQTEEEEMLFLHNYDTQFTAVGLLGFDERDYPELHFQDRQPNADRMNSMAFLQGCFQSHLVYTGCKQIIAQTHFSTMRLKTLIEFYPDAKFIYVIRNPHHVVPSFFSLLHKSIEFRWGIKQIPKKVLDRYNRRRYQSMIDLYRYFYELQKDGDLPTDQVLTVSYDELLSNLDGVFGRICAFSGLEVSETLRKKVMEKSAEQKNYVRKHKVMALEQFGVTHAMIDRDFSFVFKEYTFDD